MRFATFTQAGHRHVGRVEGDSGSETVTPLAVDAREGAQALIEHLAGGGALPAAAGPALPLSQVALEAPLPRPRRTARRRRRGEDRGHRAGARWRVRGRGER